MTSIFKSIKKRSSKVYSKIAHCKKKDQNLVKSQEVAEQNAQLENYFHDCESSQKVQIFEEMESESLGSDISNNEYKSKLREKRKFKNVLRDGAKFALKSLFWCRRAKKKKMLTNKIKKLNGMEGLKIRSNLKAHPILKYANNTDQEESTSSPERPGKRLEDLRIHNEETQYVQTALKLADQLTKIEHTQDDLICPLCLKFLVHSTVARCGHTYCYVCFQELVLVSPSCLKCDKNLRKHRIAASCKAIDSMVESMVNSLSDTDSGFDAPMLQQNDDHKIDFAKYEKEDYVRRKKEYEDYLKKKVLEDVEVGDMVDIRTPEYVWTEGIVRRLVYKPESGVKVAFIHYMDLPNSFDEEICLKSSRLATHGFFTSREDIPKLSWTDRGTKIILYEGKKLSYDLMGRVMDKYSSLVDTDESDHYEEE